MGEMMIRSWCLSGDIGGSSGWRASFTPSRSATGTIRSRNQARLAQRRAAVIGVRRAGESDAHGQYSRNEVDAFRRTPLQARSASEGKTGPAALYNSRPSASDGCACVRLRCVPRQFIGRCGRSRGSDCPTAIPGIARTSGLDPTLRERCRRHG